MASTEATEQVRAWGESLRTQFRRARLCPPPAHHARSPPQRFAAWRDCLIDLCPSAATSTEPAEELLLST